MERFRRQFGDQPTQALGAVLPARALEKLVDEEVGSFRERIYPPLTTLGLFIGQALSSDGACQDAVARRLSERTARGEAACSLNSGPYCKARKRLPLELIRRLALKVGETLEQEIPVDWKWRGRSVKLMDGTTISMPDTASNQSMYPQSGVQQAGLGFPLAMLVAVISLSTGAVLEWVLGPCRGKHTGEQALFRELMPRLQPGDIVLADRYHCNYFTAALLMSEASIWSRGNTSAGLPTSGEADAWGDGITWWTGYVPNAPPGWTPRPMHPCRSGCRCAKRKSAGVFSSRP